MTISVLKRTRGLPCPSQQKHTQSLAAKKKKKPRTGTELPIDQYTQENEHQQYKYPSTKCINQSRIKNIHDFLLNELEVLALSELKEEVNAYMMYKVAATVKCPTKTIINIQDYFSCIRSTHMEKSKYYYLDVLDAIADNKDTLMSLLYDLHEQFIQRKGCRFLVVEGDAKVYEKFQSLKFEYSDELQWLYHNILKTGIC